MVAAAAADARSIALRSTTRISERAGLNTRPFLFVSGAGRVLALPELVGRGLQPRQWDFINMNNRIALALLALLAAAPAAQAAISDPVKTDAGQISGVTLKSGVRTFKGIPFAKPPVGDLRWRDAAAA